MQEQPKANSLDNKKYQPPQMIALFFVSFILYVGYYVFNKYNNIALSSTISLYSLYALMIYLVFTGGVENTGPLWIYVVALISVFFHGLKRGLIEIAIFVVIIRGC